MHYTNQPGTLNQLLDIYIMHVYVMQGPRPANYDTEDHFLNSDDEDSNYVPYASGNDESEDQSMDTEVDAHIWLQDVDEPSSSRRFKGQK